MTQHTDAPIRFAYWMPNVSGGKPEARRGRLGKAA